MMQLCLLTCVSYRYGLRSKKFAIRRLIKLNKEKGTHIHFRFAKCGLFMSQKYRYIGASPDGIFYCKCHGFGSIEVKCPYSLKDAKSFEDAIMNDPKFPVKRNEGGELYLQQNHEYYFQIQQQMWVTGYNICLFVMYIKNDLLQLIVRHDKTFTEKLVVKEKLYFLEVIMLEMFGKWFTSKKSVVPNIVPPRENYLPCFCQEEKPNEQSVFCSNENCSIRQFHKKCIGLKIFRSTWMCKICRTNSAKEKRKSKLNEAKQDQPKRKPLGNLNR